MYHYLWKPVKILGSRLNFLNVKILLLLFTPLFLSGVFFLFNEGLLPAVVYPVLPTSFAFIGLTMVAKSFTERKNVNLGWLLIILNHFWIALAVSFNERFSFSHTAIYLSGVIVSGIVGYLCLLKLERLEKDVDLTRFQGHSYEHPTLALIFFLACLGLAGFPITTTFLGEDLIFSHIHENQLFLIVLVCLVCFGLFWFVLVCFGLFLIVFDCF